MWVHRKGAPCGPGNGELAVIPGPWGSYSYVVMKRQIPTASVLPPMEQAVSIPERAPCRLSLARRYLDPQKTGVILEKNKSDG